MTRKAIRISRELDAATIRQEGKRLVIEPVARPNSGSTLPDFTARSPKAEINPECVLGNLSSGTPELNSAA